MNAGEYMVVALFATAFAFATGMHWVWTVVYEQPERRSTAIVTAACVFVAVTCCSLGVIANAR